MLTTPKARASRRCSGGGGGAAAAARVESEVGALEELLVAAVADGEPGQHQRAALQPLDPERHLLELAGGG